MAKATKKKSKTLFADGIPYQASKISCVCGAEFAAGSTQETIRVDICSKCHPFFTGESRIVDSEGRVEKFRKKYQLAQQKKK